MNAATLTAACERLLPEALDFLRAMVAINSFTTNAPGIRRVGGRIAEAFAPLGFEAEFVPPANPAHGPHLILRRAPVADAPSVALISHLDTVFPEAEERLHDFAWRREGDRIFGPGTNDIKGGTALIYLMLAALRDERAPLFDGVNWLLLFNACEEVDSHDFARVCRGALPPETRACLIFEPDGGTDSEPSVVACRKGRATFHIGVAGRGAHAGGHHARGANAIVALAGVVSEVAEVTDYAAGLTVNVGRIEGGTVTNRVPHAATAWLEMRAFDSGTYEQARTRILSLSGPAGGCKVAVTLDDETEPWPRNAATDALIAVWENAGAALGLRLQAVPRGGLSDGNVLWMDFPTLDGLGPRGENAHCSEQSADGTKEQEWVDAASFVPKAVLNALAIEAMLAQPDAAPAMPNPPYPPAQSPAGSQARAPLSGS